MEIIAYKWQMANSAGQITLPMTSTKETVLKSLAPKTSVPQKPKQSKQKTQQPTKEQKPKTTQESKEKRRF